MAPGIGGAYPGGGDYRVGMPGIPVTGVNELVLEVLDLDAAERFYAGVLGQAQ